MLVATCSDPKLMLHMFSRNGLVYIDEDQADHATAISPDGAWLVTWQTTWGRWLEDIPRRVWFSPAEGDFFCEPQTSVYILYIYMCIIYSKSSQQLHGT